MSDQPTTTTTAPPPPPAPSGGNGNVFPAPAAATWGQGSAPVTANKRKPGVIIGAAASSVFVLGGVLGLVNLTKHDSKPAPTPIVNGPTINPNDGPTPAPVVPKPPTPVPGPTPAPVVSTTTVPPRPSPTPTPAPSSSGETQPVFGSISVTVPDGWSVAQADEGYVAMGDNDAVFQVTAVETNANASDIAEAYLQTMQGIDNVVIGDHGNAKLPSSNVVSAYYVMYDGVYVTQQGGSLPVSSQVIAYTTRDGVGVVVEATYKKGSFATYKDDFVSMINSVISTL
jgi:hypothetical protein